MTLMASSIPPLHLVVQDYQNEMQLDFFSYLILALASASYDVNGIVNRTIVLIMSGQLKQHST